MNLETKLIEENKCEYKEICSKYYRDTCKVHGDYNKCAFYNAVKNLNFIKEQKK